VKLTTRLYLAPRSIMRDAIPPLPNVFMAWCLVKHRDNFTFLLLPMFLISTFGIPYRKASVLLSVIFAMNSTAQNPQQRCYTIHRQIISLQISGRGHEIIFSFPDRGNFDVFPFNPIKVTTQKSRYPILIPKASRRGLLGCDTVQ
jgi:hypothetical protein